jgi:hypothetical protein
MNPTADADVTLMFAICCAAMFSAHPLVKHQPSTSELMTELAVVIPQISRSHSPGLNKEAWIGKDNTCTAATSTNAESNAETERFVRLGGVPMSEAVPAAL